MATKRQETRKRITKKRVQEIENYLLRINGLVNP